MLAVPSGWVKRRLRCFPAVERVDPLTGTPVIVVPERQGRPHGGPECPFCPGGIEAPAPYRVRWFANRWPALPDDRCEVVLYTPDHDAGLAEIGVKGAEEVVELWAQRTAALGSRPDVNYVLVFENRGAEVGATISHPHGQIYAYDRVPPVPARELEAAECALCAEPPEELVVARRGPWSAWVPAAAGWPYELVLAPGGHPPDLPAVAADPVLRGGLAAALVDTCSRLDGLFGAAMPYMLWVHQRPTDGRPWPGAHVHVHVAPVLRDAGVQRYVAGAELGGGILFNPVAPEDAAARLRTSPAGTPDPDSSGRRGARPGGRP
jgi:UDPglucose--hexose-1-phosphate uridylyltransferase